MGEDLTGRLFLVDDAIRSVTLVHEGRITAFRARTKRPVMPEVRDEVFERWLKGVYSIVEELERRFGSCDRIQLRFPRMYLYSFRRDRDFVLVSARRTLSASGEQRIDSEVNRFLQ